MVGLLQFPLTDLDNVSKIPTNLRQQAATNIALSREETIQWVWLSLLAEEVY